MTLTDQEYFNALPVNGLELAEEYLGQDLETLQQNGLPVCETVAGLLTIHEALQEKQDEAHSA